jgi:hypothetical protein
MPKIRRQMPGQLIATPDDIVLRRRHDEFQRGVFSMGWRIH